MKPRGRQHPSRSWRSLAVVIVGCGSVGCRHARVLRGLGVRDLRVVDPEKSRRARVRAEGAVTAGYDRLETALERDPPDAAIICTPPDLHVSQSVRCLEAGVHVLCEKPLGASLAGTGRLQAAIRRSGCIFSVGFCMRQHEALRFARRTLAGGVLGRLVSVRCRMGEHLPTVRPDYRTLFALHELGAFDLTHEIDLACWFADQPIRRVTGVCGSFSDLGFTAPDVAEVVVQFGDRCVASIHLDWFGSARVRTLELLGTKGTLLVDYSAWEHAEVALHTLASGRWRRRRFVTDRDRMFRQQDRQFLAAIREGGDPGCDFASARQSLQVISRMHRHHLRGTAARK